MYILYTLLKVVGYYDLSVLSMSVMGFKKKKFGWGVGGWGELYPSFFLMLEFFNFAKPLSLSYSLPDGAFPSIYWLGCPAIILYLQTNPLLLSDVSGDISSVAHAPIVHAKPICFIRKLTQREQCESAYIDL